MSWSFVQIIVFDLLMRVLVMARRTKSYKKLKKKVVGASSMVLLAARRHSVEEGSEGGRSLAQNSS